MPKSISFGDKTLSINSCIDLQSNDDKNYDRFLNSKSLKSNSLCDFKVNILIENLSEDLPKGYKTEHEKYSLKISEDGKATINSKYGMGAIRAMDTLAQLISTNKSGSTLDFLPIDINDEPRYPYRGFSLDASREYYPVETIKKIIDGLRISKINTLHLHLSDDDTIPVQFPSYPEMVKYTAFTDEEIYTVDDLKDLVKYAKESGVKIIPEFDVPGHTRAVGLYPPLEKIMTCKEKFYPKKMPDGQTIVGGPAFSVLNPTLDDTYEFIANIIKDLLDIFPDADFYHLGGDEVNTSGCWTNEPQIQEFMKENNMTTGSELFAYFNTRLRETLEPILQQANNGVELIHWSNSFGIDWDEGSLLQFWGNEDKIPTLIESYPNHKHIISPNNKFYFDCGTGNKYGAAL
eukprot:CAMPEP_0205826890 /NCGR_PEP_ID=MMETSP0206-20130828/30152_1 /ASSEMBLY_ACC=CAM_ASM_000279 /TAXON_ID=36767 /ORGANISM="Euplotes focardii, Strain TN1" /LENGTH=403 /DNA_ID=CAMNT_0053127217 /DNA_START=139 /DNA_END=1350 /DNA_ORIENTATION=+